ncbi:MAG: PVC-type heme-binding CxxCH protein [Planctomycetaceae bacterium]
MRRNLLLAVAIRLLIVLSLLSFRTAVGFADAELAAPSIMPASREGELARSGIKKPDGVEVQLFAAEPQLANPVAFAFDEQGRIYVCETFRQQHGVEDNRNHMSWLEDDLAARSVADRLAYFRKHLGEGVAEYAQQQDRIRRLEDTNRDGVADVETIFAAPFHQIEDGTGAGVLAHDGDLFYTNIPKLYRLRDRDGDGVAEQRDVLADGFGVRVAFRGHDMHGLTLGPEGRLYFSIGDRGYNVTTKEGNRLVRPDTGAVFRCELDGSGLEVFAYGLRNPQELAFDDFGNLFTGDNNSDGGDQARWMHVVEGSDTGWRMYYQYLSDRGPWNRERMWHPYRDDDETARVQPAYIVPAVANVSDGPSGLVYYPGVGLEDRYRGHFFLADFRGSTGRSGVRSFANEAVGATFKLTDSHWYLENLLATDVDFGYDGKLYVSDWVDGWNGPGKGRIYSFTRTAVADAVKQAQTAELVAEGFSQRSAEQLSTLLKHVDRRVRLAAQFSLADKQEVATLSRLAESGDATHVRVHAIWGLWQIGRRSASAEILRTLRGLTTSDDREVCAQACRVLGDLRDGESLDALTAVVRQGSAREQYFAAIALGRLPTGSRLPPVLGALTDLLASNAGADPVLRHAAVMGIVGQGDPNDWLKYADHPSESVHLGLVLALRRNHSALIARFLGHPNLRVVEEAARAIHDEPIAGALPALAALGEQPVPMPSDLLLRRVLNANYRLGGPTHALAATSIATLPGVPDSVFDEAVFDLLHWDQPPVLDRVTNEYRPLPARSLDAARPAVEKFVPMLMEASGARAEQGLALVARYRIAGYEDQLAKLVASSDEKSATRAAALTALLRLDYSRLPGVLETAAQSDVPELRMAAHAGLAELKSDNAVTILAAALTAPRSTTAERQQVVRQLAQLETVAADQVLLDWLQALHSTPETVPVEIHLDLLSAAAKRGSEPMRATLAKLAASPVDADPLAGFRVCLHGGDRARGKEIFFGNAAASCRRCHKVDGEGSEVGPDLSGVGTTNSREYLLESLLNPNAKIAKGFETVIFVMDDGRLYTGIVKGENDASIQLMTAQGELIRVEKSGIDQQALGKSGMPEDVAKPLSKGDLRDLVEYLSTLKAPAKDAAAHGKSSE